MTARHRPGVATFLLRLVHGLSLVAISLVLQLGWRTPVLADGGGATCEGPDLVGAPLDFAANADFWRRGPALVLGNGEMALAVPSVAGPGVGAIQVQRLSLAGVPTGPPDYLSNPPLGFPEQPSIVWDGETYGVSWLDRGNARIHLARLGPGG